MVTNLLTNAVKFTPKGGNVEVALRHDKSDMMLVVRDDGQGIDPGFLPHIFEAFRQEDDKVSRRTGGLGLGLAIVKKLVELHGGTIVAESGGPNNGSRFIIRLPVTPFTTELTATPPSPRPSTMSLDASRASAGAVQPVGRLFALRVLVVEDDHDSRELISELLGVEGARATLSESALEALELLRSAKYDVILSDVGMPEMDGLTWTALH